MRKCLLGVALLGSCYCTAQPRAIVRPSDNGEPDLSWWDDARYEQDSLEEAVILFNSGICTPNPYANTRLEVQKRIKILKKSAVGKMADFVLGTEANLVDFSASVYNLQAGKIKESRVEGKNAVHKRDSATTHVYSVALPDVTVGSVIEYNYTLRFPGYIIYRWTFQDRVPVRYSEYELFFPGSIFGVTADVSGLYELADYRVTESGRRRTFVMADLPPFREEPFMPPVYYYISAISFLPLSVTGEFDLVYAKDELKVTGLERDSIRMDSRITLEANLNVENKSLTGVVKITKRGYQAFLDRQALKKTDVDEYLRNALANPAILISEKKLESTEDTLTVVITFSFASELTSAKEDSLLFIDPQIFLVNEFKGLALETRSYPVDLGSRIEKTMIVALTIPEKYSVDQLPANTILTIPDKTARFVKSASVVGDKINLVSRLSTNKIIFNVPEYPALREFFTQVGAKRNEMIVLKKRR